MLRFCVLLVLAILSFEIRAADADTWKRWPADADEFATTIGIPPGFESVRWRPPASALPKHKAPSLLTAHFRSPDGKAQFMAIVYYVRHSPQDPEARRIKISTGRGEKVTHQDSKRRKITGEQGAYWIYDEESTVEGKGYTSFRVNTFSTSSLPGAASVLWEFRVADEATRKRYAPLWRKFKDSIEIESD